MTSSGCEPTAAPELKTSMDHSDDTSVEVERSHTEPNHKPEQAILHDEVPISYIDDVVADLVENNERSESDTTVVKKMITDLIESSKPETKESPTSPDLDFSILDSGNKACLSPVGKTFLNNYSRNYCQLQSESTDLSVRGCEKEPSMYKMLDESDSETDSATDSSAKNKMAQGQCEGVQETDSDEEVELCYSTVSDPQPDQTECSASLTQDITRNQAARDILQSLDDVASKAEHSSRSLIHHEPLKLESVLNVGSNGVPDKDVCGSQRTSSKSENFEKVLFPGSSQDRTSKLDSNPPFPSDSPEAAELPAQKDAERGNKEKIRTLSSSDHKAGRAVEDKSLNNALTTSQLLSSRLGQEETPSTSSKLKGLSIKSKCNGQEQPVHRPASPLFKKADSPVHASKRITSAANTITSFLEKSSTESSMISRDSTKPNKTIQGSDSTKPESFHSNSIEVTSKSEATIKQRSFIEVRLLSSSIPSSVPVLTCRESSGSYNPGQGSSLNPKDSPVHEESGPKLPSISVKSSVSRPEPNNCAHKPQFKVNTTFAETASYKAGKSKVFHRILDRRSYSAGGGPQDPKCFSVRQRIKSFENLASFGPVMRCLDIHSYAVSSKTPLDRRRSANTSSLGVQSTDSRSLKRSLSSCVKTSNSSSSQQPQNSFSSLILNCSEPATFDQSTEPHARRTPPVEDAVSQASPVLQTPPVLRSRNARAGNGISRSKLRELRALSMPELDKLCTEDFSHDPGNAMFKTELEIHPTGTTTCTVVTRVRTADPGMPGIITNGDHDQTQTGGHSSWSISMKDLLSSPLDQSKVQKALNVPTATRDLKNLMEEVNSVSEGKEDVHVVVLMKEVGSGLGFSIAGGVDLEQKSVTVHRVFTQGAAGLEGTILQGDAVLSINGKSLHGMTHGEALSCLHQTRLASQAVVVIQRGKNSEPVSPGQDVALKYGTRISLTRRQSNGLNEAAVEVGPGGALSVELVKTSAGLGFSLEGGKASAHGDRPLYIKRIFRGGAAELSQVIGVGDEVLAINGNSLVGLMHYDAWNIIKTVSEGPIQLAIRKPRTSV